MSKGIPSLSSAVSASAGLVILSYSILGCLNHESGTPDPALIPSDAPY